MSPVERLELSIRLRAMVMERCEREMAFNEKSFGPYPVNAVHVAGLVEDLLKLIEERES